jgi:hypothetical protein
MWGTATPDTSVLDRARLRVMTATDSDIGGADVGHRHGITDGYAGPTIERIDATALRISDRANMQTVGIPRRDI